MAPHSFLRGITLLVGLCALGFALERVSPIAGAQPTSSVVAQLAAVELTDQVRYSVALLHVSDSGLDNVRVQVALPPNTVVAEVLETPGRTAFVGVEGGALTWTAPRIAPDATADAISFALRRPLTAEALVRVTWSGGSTETRVRPQPRSATGAPADLIVGASGTGEGMVPAGASGVQIRVEAGLVPDGTPLRISTGDVATISLPDGDLWWCSVLTIEGLPEGMSALVVTPTRQPLRPFAEVSLSRRTADGWVTLDQVGIVSADGQFVAFNHPGGTVAAGVTNGLQARPVPIGAIPTLQPIPTQVAPTATPTAVPQPQLVASITGPGVIRGIDSVTYTINVQNTGTAPSNGTYVDIRENSLGVDFTSFSGGQNIAADPAIVQSSGGIRQARAEIANLNIPAGATYTTSLHLVNWNHLREKTGSLSLTARNNFPNAATTSTSASINIVVNPR